ncbi:MAG: DUF4835 family protein [Bacteroidia bacterium]
MKLYFSLFCFLLLTQFSAFSQELLCKVTINATQVQGDKEVFDNMQNAITRYLNLTKWTNDSYEPNERIKCFINIVITKRDLDNFNATVNIRSVRPVYNSTYETSVANLSDKDFSFVYIPFQELQFSDNTYTDNLTSLLNYYAYMIIGLDYNSFSANGGTPYFQKAQVIADLAGAANSGDGGWSSTGNIKNRYWLAENMLNTSYKGFHTCMQKYYREGLDKMESDPMKGRKAILDAVKEMQKVYKQNPMLYCIRIFFDAKSEEMISVFGKALMPDKTAFLQLMQEMDPGNNAYNAIMDMK